jgi:hypothetical protein
VATSFEAEALAALYSLQRVVQLGMSRIILEIDVTELVRGLTSLDLDQSVMAASSSKSETSSLFTWLIIRFLACFFSRNSIFSHNKSVNNIFQPAYQPSRTGPSLASRLITVTFGTVRGIATKWQIALQCMGRAWLARVRPSS